MGVAGSGKTTVMAALEDRLGWPTLEGDAVHPPANVAKMAAGIPLTDADREPWLREIRAWIADRAAAGEGCLVTCSALRRRYRDALTAGLPGVRFVHLVAPPGALEARIRARSGHFMPPAMLASQLATLEPLAADERGFEVDATQPPAVVAETIVRRLGR